MPCVISKICLQNSGFEFSCHSFLSHIWVAVHLGAFPHLSKTGSKDGASFASKAGWRISPLLLLFLTATWGSSWELVILPSPTEAWWLDGDALAGVDPSQPCGAAILGLRGYIYFSPHPNVQSLFSKVPYVSECLGLEELFESATGMYVWSQSLPTKM